MATISGINITTPKIQSKSTATATSSHIRAGAPWIRSGDQFRNARRMYLKPAAAAPERISEKVAESIKKAEETCAEDPKSGECVAAWDEVEELSAAASHARDRKKETDALENYCKDNPETDECRTYDN